MKGIAKFKFSQKESKRFNKKIYRFNAETIKPSELKKEIINSNADILILRLPSESKNKHSELSKMGFPLIHTDSLVYYFTSLAALEINETRNKLSLELIDEYNESRLEDMIPIIFNNYRNHYFSNPILEHNKIIEGYVEWAKSYVGGSNQISWLAKIENDIVGFATCTYDDQKQECEGVLYGVLPQFSGRGVYSDIIRLTQKFFKQKGFRHMWVSTQIQNYAVQKVWQREGFFLKKSFETYHINSMLSYSLNDSEEFDFNVSETTLNQFAEFSGDKNELHFNASFAEELGFEDRIVHGMIFSSYLSKYFGVHYPGNGTIFLDNKNIFLKPLYLNKDYKTIINTLSILDNGIISVLAKVYDECNNLCLISYNTLLNRSFKKT